MNQQKQSYLVPFIMMVVLMSLIGLITSLNQQFQAPMQAAYMLKAGTWTNTLTVGIVFAFFLAYLVIGPISAKYIDNNGYKKTLIVGLIILIIAFGLYELSAFVFDKVDFPKFKDAINEAKKIAAQYMPNNKIASINTMKATAATTGDFHVEVTKFNEYAGLTWLKGLDIPMAYWVFVVAAFVAGTALTFLQAVVNPYIVACDVKGTSGVQRQSIAGAGNSLMTTIGPIIVAYIIFQHKEGLNINITSLYIPIAVLMVLVLIIIFGLNATHLPSIASTEKKKDEVLPDSVWSFRHLALGVVAIFFYVGVEVCVGSNINLYAKGEGFTITSAAQLAMFYWLGLLIGRALGSLFSKLKANVQLTVTSIIAAILVTLSMFTGNPWLLVGVGLCHSIMWPSIFDLAIAKLGRYTNKGSGALMMGVVGGAVLPLLQAFLADKVMNGWQWTWILVIISELYLLFYALYGYRVLKTDEVATAKEPVDKHIEI